MINFYIPNLYNIDECIWGKINELSKFILDTLIYILKA